MLWSCIVHNNWSWIGPNDYQIVFKDQYALFWFCVQGGGKTTGDSLRKHSHISKQELSCLNTESFSFPNLISCNSLSSSACINLQSVKENSDARLHPKEKQQCNNTVLFCLDFPFLLVFSSDRKTGHWSDYNTIHFPHTTGWVYTLKCMLKHYFWTLNSFLSTDLIQLVNGSYGFAAINCSCTSELEYGKSYSQHTQ